MRIGSGLTKASTSGDTFFFNKCHRCRFYFVQYSLFHRPDLIADTAYTVGSGAPPKRLGAREAPESPGREGSPCCCSLRGCLQLWPHCSLAPTHLRRPSKGHLVAMLRTAVFALFAATLRNHVLGAIAERYDKTCPACERSLRQAGFARYALRYLLTLEPSLAPSAAPASLPPATPTNLNAFRSAHCVALAISGAPASAPPTHPSSMPPDS